MLLLLPFAFSFPTQAEDNSPEAVVNPDADQNPATPGSGNELPQTPDSNLNSTNGNSETPADNPDQPEIPATPEEAVIDPEDQEIPLAKDVIPYSVREATPLMSPGPGDIAIDATNFPDEQFRIYIEKFDLNKDKSLSQYELEQAYVIYVSYKAITNLKGLEYFTNLRKLECSGRGLNELDISHNTKLEELQCERNNLSTLDLSHNPLLRKLECKENKLSTLDLSHNPNLEELRCENNHLTSLDVSKNKKLKKLYCPSNRIEALDVNENTELTNLDCSSNQIKKLELDHNLKLEGLNCNDNMLSELDVRNNKKLYDLACGGNLLQDLDLKNNIDLGTLDCSGNKLTQIDTSQNVNLWWFACHLNQISHLDVSKNLSLGVFSFYNNLITSIDLKKNDELKELYCSDNQLTTLDLSNNSKLITLYTQNNHISSLDLSSNPNFQNLVATDQTYSIEVDKDTLEFDLSSLPGNFNPAMASKWVGADVVPGSTILKLDSSRPTAVTYLYYSNFNNNPFFPIDDLRSKFNVTLYVTYVEGPPKNILIPCPYGAVICPTQPAYQTIPLTPVPVQQVPADNIQGQVAQLPKTGEQDAKAVAISSLLLLSLGAFFMISRRK